MCVRLGNVRVGRYHPVDGCHDHLKQGDELRVVLGANIESSNFRKAFQSEVAEVGSLEELSEGDRLGAAGKAIDGDLRAELEHPRS